MTCFSIHFIHLALILVCTDVLVYRALALHHQPRPNFGTNGKLVMSESAGGNQALIQKDGMIVVSARTRAAGSTRDYPLLIRLWP